MPTRLFRTTTFRIAIIYLALFGATVLALVGFIYWSTTDLIERQTRETVEAEIRGLAEQYRAQGLGRLIRAIEERSGPRGDKANVYLLTNPAFQRLAGNLAAWPASALPDGGDWLQVELRRTDDADAAQHMIRARTFDLPGGLHLLIGRDMAELAKFRAIMLRALALALLPALLFALVGGVLIGRYAQRRVEAVRAASQAIVQGNLSQRVPVSGGGDEFDRLAQTINEMLDRIDALMTGMRAVTDSLAHDLRSPLTRAKSSIEQALRQDADAATAHEALTQVGVELDAILQTFEALIRIAQAEAGMDRAALAPVDLSALASDLVEVYQPLAEDGGLTLVADVAAAVQVVGHRELLAQTIANLLGNAIKYTPAGGRVDLTLARTGGDAVLTVADSGPGIPAAERERVLQRFVRLDSSRGTPGSGLGLSLVAAVAKLHGARLVLADNAPGLRVTLRLPME